VTDAFRPETLDDALAVLTMENTVPVAGCTDLMVIDHAQHREHESVVDLAYVPELRGIRETPDGLWIGASTTFAQLRASEPVCERFPVIADMAATIGALQIQNRATVGGNIANASPAGDSLPVWLALGAVVDIAAPGTRRQVPYDEMHLGYRQTALEAGELIVGLTVPFARHEDAVPIQRYWKVGTRAAQAISKVVVALRAESRDGVLHDLRIAAGSVAPTPVRLRAAEELCAGKPMTASLAAEAGRAAASEVTPIDDVRSTADYRRFVIARVVRRMLLG